MKVQCPNHRYMPVFRVAKTTMRGEAPCGCRFARLSDHEPFMWGNAHPTAPKPKPLSGNILTELDEVLACIPMPPVKPPKDSVNHPTHYQDGPACEHCGEPVERIVVTRRHNFNIGNAIKYLWRAGKKDTAKHIEDLQKAKWYIDDEIKRLQAERGELK